MPGIKAIPVPVEEEAPEAAEPKEEKQESEEAKEEQTAQIEPAKKKRRMKAEIEKEKLEKAMKKAEKEQEKVDLKARVKCPVCKKGPMSAHTLTYKHTCAESDLKKLPKAPTLEERFPEPESPPPNRHRKSERRLCNMLKAKKNQKIGLKLCPLPHLLCDSLRN